MRVAVLFSGGKDSCYAVWVLQHLGWEVARLVTVKPSASDSMMFHYPSLDWTGLQAQAMGIPHEMIEAGEDELNDLEKALVATRREYGIVGLATGAIASDYQKSRFDQICDSAGLKSYSPLWHKDPRVVVNDLLQAGFRVIMTGVGAFGLDESWLGRELTRAEWSRLSDLTVRHGIHLTGEGGEYETFVLDAPHFKQEIVIDQSRRVWMGQSGHLVIEKASLWDKLGNR